MEISVRHQDGFGIVSVEGKLIRDSLEEFKTRLQELAVDNGVRGVALDFEAVEYLDSAGLGACALSGKNLKDHGDKHLVMYGAAPMITKMWTLIRLDKNIPLFATEKEALVYLGTLSADAGVASQDEDR